MAHILDTNGIVSELEKIINEAEKYICLISPYIQLSESHFNRLKQASERGVCIRLIHGKSRDYQKEKEVEKFKSIQNCKILYCSNLHAKCFYNESDMVVSSLNLIEYSERRNFELGVGISKAKDSAMFDEMLRKTNEILKSENTYIEWGEKVIDSFAENPNAEKEQIVELGYLTGRGVCVSCGCNIPFNPDYLLCSKCFAKSFYNNIYFRYCHSCGKNTVNRKPFCEDCWEKVRLYRR